MLTTTFIVTEFAPWMYCEGRGRQLFSTESLVVAKTYALKYVEKLWREHYDKEGNAPDNVEVRVYRMTIASNRKDPFRYTFIEEVNRDFIREHERGCDVEECPYSSHVDY